MAQPVLDSNLPGQKLPVLVTGAAGFIGARFVEALAGSGTPVISVDARSYFENRKEHQGIPFGQIVDRDELLAWLSSDKPNLMAIVHLGACTDTTEMDEAYLARVNLEYSQALWRHCSSHSVPLVYASSAATYGAGEKGYDDDESRIPELVPLNPYGVSKQRFDLWALEQERNGQFPPSWSGFKFFNVYGFGERHKDAMSSVVLKAYDQIRGGAPAVRLFKSHRPDVAHGNQRRDFVYVDDVISVLRFAMEKPIRRGIFNLGSGQARSFLDLVTAVYQAMSKELRIEFVDTPVEIRDKYQYFTEAKMDRLRAEGYAKSFTPLEEGISRYVATLARMAD